MESPRAGTLAIFVTTIFKLIPDHQRENCEICSGPISAQSIIRGSHQRCSVRKGFLRNLEKFTGKNLCQSLFFNKVAG